jgi:poly-beta-hydroxybutyrate-responsive repressor
MPAKKGRQSRHLPAFILLTVAEGPLHGGAIHSELLRRIPGFTVDTGAVYRTLKILETDGEVESSWDTAGSGPARKIYRLTTAGAKKLEAWKTDIEYRLTILRHFLTAYDQLKPDQAATKEPPRTQA